VTIASAGPGRPFSDSARPPKTCIEGGGIMSDDQPKTSGFSTQHMALLGTVASLGTDGVSFALRCRSGDVFDVRVCTEATFSVARNLDDLDRDRMPNPSPPYDPSKLSERVRKYIVKDYMIAVAGTKIDQGGKTRFDAHSITLLTGDQDQFVFEDTHWWLTQIATFADQWLDDLFAEKRSYKWDDFAQFYRTNLNILGQPTDDKVQECATLSRLIYGLSSCYLLTGGDRYLLAAEAGVKYQRETFRSLSHDGRYCFWQFGKRERARGAVMILPSENPDDLGTIPLYEQIYAIAGLCQFYRITQDWEVLEDIARTVKVFQDFYRDAKGFGYTETGGYFSHLDYATLRPDVESLGKNKLRKNWNSVGDHIPAYLINVILALHPLPRGGKDTELAEKLLATCRKILDETTDLILTKFPDEASKFVNERFFADWTPDHEWGWQQNRGIVGHNFKIAWNMTRVANFYRSEAARLECETPDEANALKARAGSYETLAAKLVAHMTEAGIDELRGGCFDALERQPDGPVEFTWGNTKDFWQQEQAILAYLIVYNTSKDPEHLRLAREMMAFWTLYFLDHDNRGVFFRVTENGDPVIQGAYSQKAGHAIAGYHSFELNYLANLYLRTYVRPTGKICTMTGNSVFPIVDETFCIFFHPDVRCAHTTLNVLPDFLPPGAVEITRISVGGIPRTNFDPNNFQIELERHELGTRVVVEFTPLGRKANG
jgi:mannose/cellobiose epimerase-like protein (N-acyl-D-glucosamine 2-epimerase family)